MISSAGIARHDQPPFDQDGERRNPWWGDPSHRVLARDTTEGDVRLYHRHIDPRPGEQDLDCVLPLRRLAEAQALGAIGSVAPSHYSFLGYLLDAEPFLSETVPQIVARMKAEEVDAALRATLAALAAAREYGEVIDLPFQWPETRGRALGKLPEEPPIAALCKAKPWLFLKLLRGELPAPDAGPGAGGNSGGAPRAR